MYPLGTLAIIVISLANHLHAVSQEKPELAITGPSVIPNLENKRFSRLLHDNAASLQFSSISNLSPPLSGLPKDFKESKSKNPKKVSLSISPTNFGRRTLDYDDTDSFDDNGEPLQRVITAPQAGNEYVYIRQGGVQTDQQQAAAASVTTINKQPLSHRVPLTLLKQSNGKTVNLSPIYSEENGGVHVPLFYQDMLNGKSDIAKEDTATTVDDQGEKEETEVTTFPTLQNDDPQMVVNVVTSAPRIEVEGQNETVSPVITTTQSTPVTTSTTFATTTTTTKPVVVSTSPTPAGDDLKENLVVQSSRRIGAFPDFEDSPARLQASESNAQPARVNVRPASSGKELEYEYVYYYYDDSEENLSNDTAKTPGEHKKLASENGVGAAGKVPVAAASPDDFDDEDLEDDPPHAPAPSRTSTPSTTTLRPTTPTTTTTTRRVTTTTTTTTPIPIRVISPADKFSTGGVNEISRSPKALPSDKVSSSPEADYKFESGNFDPELYEYEDEEVQVKAKGQPQQQPSEEEDEDEKPVAMVVLGPTVAATLTSSSPAEVPESLVQKSHPASVNTPIVLKQSNLLQSVPASRLQFQQQVQATQVPLTTSSTTTTVSVESEPSTRASSSRFRGGSPRVRGEVKAETETSSTATVEDTETPTRSRPPTFTRGRIPSRRPAADSNSSPSTESPEAVSSPRPSHTRSRFPSRITTSTAAPSTTTTTTTPAPIVRVESQSQTVEEHDSDVKDNFARNKATNDLFTFTRLQQAISSRTPARKDLGHGPVFPKQTSSSSTSSSSSEQSTESFASSEATTLSSVSEIRVDEHIPAVTPATTTTTTTTTTTPKPATLDKFGKQRNRFGTGRVRPSTPAADSDSPSSTTEATSRAPSRGRFGGGRRRPTANTPEAISEGPSSLTSQTSEPEKPRVIPTRNRFSGRTRPTTEASTTSSGYEKKTENTDSASPSPAQVGARRRPIFQGRRRNPTVSNATQDAGTDASPSSDPVPSPSTQVSDASPVPDAERKRPGLPNVQRRRPQVGGPRRGARIGGSTSTTEKAVDPAVEQDGEPTVAAVENSEPSTSTKLAVQTPTVENQRGTTGVLGRLRTKPRLVATTTTAAPEVVAKDKKPSRLNGILNRRKPGTLVSQSVTTAAPVKPEEHEGNEDANNAQEQEDAQHKGVVVQVSSSVTESEEVHQGGEETEPSSTTAASILNRLKSQRKPGSIFRKRTEPQE